MDIAAGPFAIHGPRTPASPVILSVPHGGRHYPATMAAMLRVAPDRLALLEDRHSDTLALAAREERTALVALNGRGWIDLNRGEQDRDPLLEPGGAMPARHASGKVRSGLGLIPRRTAATGDLWRRRLTPAEVVARIHSDHRPYHAELARLAATARARFGIAVIVDLHSMPPLEGADDPPRLVIGDRFGATAGARFAAIAEAAAAGAGLTVARNIPYAGGHIVERHGAPARGTHALQVEIDRSLYLDSTLDRPGVGFARTAAALRHLLDAITDATLAGTASPLPGAIAAE